MKKYRRISVFLPCATLVKHLKYYIIIFNSYGTEGFYTLSLLLKR